MVASLIPVLVVCLQALSQRSTWVGAAGMSLISVIGVYLAAGLVVGTLVGVLAPLARFAVGSIVIGIVAAVTLYSIVVVMADGLGAYSPVFPLLIGVPVGGSVGFAIWKDSRKTARRDD